MRRLLRFGLILVLCGLFTLKFIFTVGAEDTPLPPLELLTPDNASRLELLAEFGTGILTEAFAWSPDSAALAIGGTTGIHIYNPHDFDAPPQFLPIIGVVTQVGYSPDGRYLGYIVDERLYMLELATQTLRGRPRKADIFAFSPDGGLLVIGNFGNAPGDGRTWGGSVLEVRDFRYMRLLKTLLVGFDVSSFAVESIPEVAFSPDGTYLAAGWLSVDVFDACGLEKAAVRLWRVEDVLTLPETTLNADEYIASTRLDEYFQIAFHPTENQLAAISWHEFFGARHTILYFNPLQSDQDTEFRIWEMTYAGRSGETAAYDDEYLTDIAFSPKTGFAAGLVMSHPDNFLRFMDLSHNEIVAEWSFSTYLTTLGFSPDGAFVVGANAHELWIWREDGTLAARLGTPKPEFSFDYPFRAAAAPDGSAFITYDLDNHAHLWRFDAEHGAFMEQPVPEDYRVWYDESTIRWRTEWVQANPISTNQVTADPAQIAATLPEGGDFSPDGTRVLIGSYTQDGCGSNFSDLNMYDVQTGQALMQINLGTYSGGYGLAFGSAIFTPDSHLLLASNDYRGYIFDAVTGEEIAAIPMLTNSLLTISEDGTRLIAARRDGYVSVWGVPAP